MGDVIEVLKEAGVRDSVKVIVGGAPVTPAFAAEIEADGYSRDASSAVREMKKLLGV
jgi:methanogenic corrinoid protein MtbC1